VLLHCFRRELAAQSTARAIVRVWRLVGWILSFLTRLRHHAAQAFKETVLYRFQLYGSLAAVMFSIVGPLLGAAQGYVLRLRYRPRLRLRYVATDASYVPMSVVPTASYVPASDAPGCALVVAKAL
jgi:hypothetical protein